jgi:chromosome segregation ATPase
MVVPYWKKHLSSTKVPTARRLNTKRRRKKLIETLEDVEQDKKLHNVRKREKRAKNRIEGLKKEVKALKNKDKESMIKETKLNNKISVLESHAARLELELEKLDNRDRFQFKEGGKFSPAFSALIADLIATCRLSA